MSTDATDGTGALDEEKSPSRRRRWLGGAVVVLVGVVGFSAATGQDLIDLPAWANIPGVDLPVIGDKDAIDCRLSIADASADPVRVQIDITDGRSETYGDYQFVWNNGNLVDSTGFDRPSDSRFIVPAISDRPEQFFSISIEPEREGRVFCESILIS